MNLTKKISLRSLDWMFDLSLCIYLTGYILMTSMLAGSIVGRPLVGALMLSLALLLAREALTFLFVERYRPQDYVFFVMCLFFSYIANRNFSGGMASMFFLVFGARNMQPKRVFELSLAVVTIVVFGIYVLSIRGILENHVYISTDSGRDRFCYGFLYCLHFPMYLRNITFLIILLRRERLSWAGIALLALLNTWAYRECEGDLVFGTAMLVLLLAALMKRFPQLLTSEEKLPGGIRKFCTWILALACPIFSVLGVLTAAVFDKSSHWQARLDSLIGHRLSLGHGSLNQYGVSLLGKEINWLGAGLGSDGLRGTGKYNYVDSMYVQVLQRYGLLMFLLLMLIMTLAMVIAAWRKDYWLLLLLAASAGHAFFDDLVFYVYFNTSLLAVGMLIGSTDLKEFFTGFTAGKRKGLPPAGTPEEKPR